MSGLLYSTNVFLKLLISELYARNTHYVWCSEFFDSTTMDRYSVRSQIAPSSNPADIYRTLRDSVIRRDQHCYKIREQKVSLKNLALKWEEDRTITLEQKQEIIYLVDHASFEDWRPLIYVIPRAPVESRLKIVPMSQRASIGIEYIVPDLERSEFDILEP